jgi:ABC-2 type transport system permease protein
VIALLRVELVKALVRLRTYVAFGIMIAIPVIMTIAINANPPGRGEQGRGGGLFFLSTLTGLIVPAAALRVTSAFLLVVVVAFFGGDAIAGEASWGNLRPIGRGRLIAVKFTVAVVCAWLATLLVVLTGLVAGGIAFGFHGLDSPILALAGRSQTTGQLLAHLGLATVYVAWSLTGVVALSFMVSCMTDAPAGAIFAGVGVYITSLILDGITAIPSGLRNVLPTHYIDSWSDMFTRNQVSSDMTKGALLQLAYIVVFVGIATWYFRRKDVLS